MFNFLNGHQIATTWFFTGNITKKLASRNAQFKEIRI